MTRLHLTAVPAGSPISAVDLPATVDNTAGNGPLDALRSANDLSACLLPLIDALGWKGDPRHVAEAVPHFIDSLDITGFLNVMGNLNYGCRWADIRLDRVDARMMPCLFVPKGRPAVIVLGTESGTIRIVDGGTGAVTDGAPPAWEGTAYFFTPVEEEERGPKPAENGWFWSTMRRFRGLVCQLLGASLILNLLALATPLFVMSIYDRVIPTGSVVTLAYFGVGVLIAMLSDFMLRTVRARVLAFVGARIDTILGGAVFQRILFLPPSLTEGSTIGAQVARLKSFESVRDVFSGPIALILLELPFVVIFIIAIGILGGPIATVPIFMLGLFALLGVAMAPVVRSSMAKAAKAASRKQEFVIETLSNVRAIKYSGAEAVWLERFRALSAKAAMDGFRTSQVAALISTISHVLMVSAGVATIGFGVVRVIGGEMTLGALVASMILVWRVLAPLQTGFLVINKISQVRSSIAQLNSLMSMRPERSRGAMPAPLDNVQGRVTFSRVSLRYSADADPAIVGASFDVEPGEVVAIVGANGSGKSTLLKLLLGMHAPQAGSILIDNRDIRQIDPIELRHAIGYVPQTCQFFYGTIAQNLRLANPLASDGELLEAARRAGVLEDILALEQGSGKWRRTGFDVRVGDASVKQIPASLQQRLNLARAYLKRAPIMLFDEPGAGLDFVGDQKFIETVKQLRGKATIFIVTHRPSHMKAADKIIWLEGGQVMAAGPVEDVMKRMPGGIL